MNPDCTHLHWQPVLLVKVLQQPFGELYTGLSVKRLYLAAHPAGILCADWTLPADERFLPLVQFTGWQPERDVPFVLPALYHRSAPITAAALIPSGTWVLPYRDELYHLYDRAQTALHTLLRQVHLAPTDPRTLRLLNRWEL